ncbi:MAG: LysE family translocator [Chitinophagaceae bacterium]
MLAAVVKGFVLGIMLSISVGPVIFSIIKQSIINGRKGGFYFIAGVSASDISLVLVCNVFTTLFGMLMAHETTIGVAGSIFLVVMGIYTIFFKKLPVPDERNKAVSSNFRKRDALAIFFSGYFMNTLNPGAFLFWFAAGAAIIEDANKTPHPLPYKIIVFTTCLLVVLLADIIKVLFAGKIREKLTSHVMGVINKISGLILLGFGMALMLSILL